MIRFWSERLIDMRRPVLSRANWFDVILLFIVSGLPFGCSRVPLSPAEVHEVSSDQCFSSKVLKLVQAAEAGDVAKIDSLVKEGVDVNAVGTWGMTPLFRTLLSGNKEGFKCLLEHGANPNLRHVRGMAVMHEAASTSDPYWLKEALQHGGDPNLLDTGNPFTNDNTPLFYAARGNLECVKLLIAAGADVNDRNKSGQSPLEIAAGYPAYDIVMALLEAGIDYQSPMQPNWFTLSRWIEIQSDASFSTDQKADFQRTREFLRSKQGKGK